MLTACGYPDADEQPGIYIYVLQMKCLRPSLYLSEEKAYEVVVTKYTCY